MNSIETQLHSWQPRRPSARLKRHIFSVSTRRLRALVWSLPLAPAAACFLMVICALHSGNELSGGTGLSGLAGAALASNQMVHVAGSYRQDHNDFSALTFEWTKHSSSTSSIGSFSPDKVN